MIFNLSGCCGTDCKLELAILQLAVTVGTNQCCPVFSTGIFAAAISMTLVPAAS